MRRPSSSREGFLRLGERPDEHRYLVNVPSEGYRFVGELTDLDDVTAGYTVTDEAPPRFVEWVER